MTTMRQIMGRKGVVGLNELWQFLLFNERRWP